MAIVLVGGGGFAKEVVQYIWDAQLGPIKGVLSCDQPARELSMLAYLGDDDSYLPSEGDTFLMAIGDARRRAAIWERLQGRGASWSTLIHPTSYVAPSATVSPGVIVCPFAFVGVHSKLAGNVVLNTYASVGHDAVVGASSVLSPYACANGGATIGTAVFLGSHAVVTPNIAIGDICKIAAGSVVTEDAPRGSLLIGNPARGRVMFR